MVFIVTTPLKSFFKIKLSKVTCSLYRPDPNYNSNFYFKGNFDNYCHFKSSITGDSTCWTDKKTFLYETINPHLLISKLFEISVYSKNSEDGFRGTAIVDLLTLATGPRNIVLTLQNGDEAVGRIWFVLEMTEMCESICTLTNLRIKEEEGARDPRSAASSSSSSLLRSGGWELFVLKRAENEGYSFGSAAPVEDHSPLETRFPEPLPQHHFSMDSVNMLSLTGLLFLIRVEQTEQVLAEAAVSFAEALRQAIQSTDGGTLTTDPTFHSDSSGNQNSSSNAADQCDDDNDEMNHQDSADVLVSEPLVVKDQGRRFELRDVPFAFVDRQQPCGLRLSCSVHLSKVIKFVQMEVGTTVDGVVCGLPTPGFVRPPFVRELTMDEDGMWLLDDEEHDHDGTVTKYDATVAAAGTTSPQARDEVDAESVGVTFETEV